jgi:hypothetical protein
VVCQCVRLQGRGAVTLAVCAYPRSRFDGVIVLLVCVVIVVDELLVFIFVLFLVIKEVVVIKVLILEVLVLVVEVLLLVGGVLLTAPASRARPSRPRLLADLPRPPALTPAI